MIEVAPSAWLTSVLAHAGGLAAVLLVARSTPVAVSLPETIEMTMTSAEPPPPEVQAPAAVAESAAATAAVPVPPDAPPAKPTPRWSPSTPAPDPPAGPEPELDLTGTTLTSDRGTFATITGNGSTMNGPIGSGRGRSPAAAAAVATGSAGVTVSAGPALTPREDLARLPAPPDLSERLLAHYPPRAKALGDAGHATLSVVVLPDGTVGAADVRGASSVEFGRACKETVTGSRWLPPVDRNGKLVATRVGYTCRFDVR